MDVYEHTLAIATDTSGARLELARELLSAGKETVFLEKTIFLSARGDRILCEVFTRLPDHARNAAGFNAEIAAARALLESSTIADAVKARPQEWIVIEDAGMGTEQLWP